MTWGLLAWVFGLATAFSIVASFIGVPFWLGAPIVCAIGFIAGRISRHNSNLKKWDRQP